MAFAAGSAITRGEGVRYAKELETLAISVAKNDEDLPLSVSAQGAPVATASAATTCMAGDDNTCCNFAGLSNGMLNCW